MDDTIEDYIKNTIKQLENAGGKDYELGHTLNFTVQLSTTKEIGGGLKVGIAYAGIDGKKNSSNQVTHTVNFSYTHKKRKAKEEKKSIQLFNQVFENLLYLSEQTDDEE